eukprot:Nk52_evm6s218 gene=Nk52_evmTU6s218
MEIEAENNSVVLPGMRLGRVLGAEDGVSDRVEEGKVGAKGVRIGPGVVQESDHELMAAKAGILKSKKGATASRVWIDSRQRRYIAVKEEAVIGIITEKLGGENYRVDIGTSSSAVLMGLSFEGATRKNRPMLQVGDCVYARICLADPDLEPELTCVGASGKSDGLGELSGGYLFECSSLLARRLLFPRCAVLDFLGKHIGFELTIGLNGRVWVKSNSHAETIVICNAIQYSEFMSQKKTESLVKLLIEKLHS